MAVVFVTVFVDLIGFGIILPMLPWFASHYGMKGVAVAAMASVYSLMQFLCAPFWGKLSDRIGRRPVMLVSLAGSTVSYLALGFCDGYWAIFATRVFAGLFGANIGVASAYIADITTPENRSRGMGLIGAAFGLGFVLGPALGALIIWFFENPVHPERAYHAIGWVAGGICGINFLVACWKLVESRSPNSDAGRATEPCSFASGWSRAFSRPLVGYLIVLYFVFGFGFSNFEALFALLIQANLHYDVMRGNLFLLFLGLVVAAVQGGLIGRLVQMFGERRLILAGALIFSAGLVALPFVGHVLWLLAALFTIGIGQGLNRSSILGLISQSIGSDEQGEVLGVAQAAGSLARIVGPLAGGLMFDHMGRMVPFVVAGALVFLTLLVGARWIFPTGKVEMSGQTQTGLP